MGKLTVCIVSTVFILFSANITVADRSNANESRTMAEPPPIPSKSYKSRRRKDIKSKPAEVSKKKKKGFYEEYRVNGRLYMIKITPNRGKPYYFIDEAGKGDFKHSDLEPTDNRSKWILRKF